MASVCESKWCSRRKNSGQETEHAHFKVIEVHGQLKGKHLEKKEDVKITCRADGMTIDLPDTGSPDFTYEGRFDGDNYPGVYDRNEDHISGTCTIYTRDKRGGIKATVADDWESEKTT